MRSAAILAIVAGVAGSACTEEYPEAQVNAPAPTYTTAQQAEAQEQPTIIALDYPVAQGGDVRVASFGLVDMGAQTQSAQHLSALRVRLTLNNRSNASWTLDTREQKVDLSGYGTSVAAFAAADPGSKPPAIVVEPGGHRVVDLFFPLPAQLETGGQMPQKFDVLWRIQTGSGPVAQRTTIDEGLAREQQEAQNVQPNIQVAPDDYDYGEDLAAGPTWYNPYYPYYGFGVAIPPVFIGGPLWFHHYGYWGHPRYYGHGYYHGGPHGYYGHGYYGHGHGYYGHGYYGHGGGRFHGGGFRGGGGFHGGYHGGGGFHGGGGHGGGGHGGGGHR